MISSEVQRTLVKSPPELWTELSDPDALARHLGELGEIRITRIDPEQKVEWEAEDTTGTVRLKPSGWGTKVTLTVTREIPTPEPSIEPTPEPVVVVEPEPEPRRGLFARIFGRRRKLEPMSEPEPQAQEEDQPDIAAELAALEESMAAETIAVLTSVLDRLGAAHHRPFSRA